MFSSVYTDGSHLTLVLVDGTTIVIPITAELAIEFSQPNNITLAPGSTVSINYTITSVTGSASIEVIPTSGIKAKVAEDGLGGTITIILSDNVDYEYDKVSVIVTCGTYTVLKRITFTENGRIVITDDTTALVTCKGGTAQFVYASNVDCQVNIPQNALSWVTRTGTKALTSHTLEFAISANQSNLQRTAVITVTSPSSNDRAEFTIVQYGHTASFAITSSGSDALVPSISGFNLSGLVDWNGEVEQWSANATKTFADGLLQHTSEYFVSNASGFSLSSLTALVDINVSGF